MNDVARYLVVWRDEVEQVEDFSLWGRAARWHRTVQEIDPEAQILYWHAGAQQYLPASMPVEHPVTRLPLFVPHGLLNRA